MQKLKESLDPLNMNMKYFLLMTEAPIGRSPSLRRSRQRTINMVSPESATQFWADCCICGGFDFSRGDVVVTMDGDLQNDPADIAKAPRTDQGK